MTDGKDAIDVGNLLLRSLHRGYAELLSEIHTVDGAAAAEMLAESGWSVRDHVAHLSAWEALELARAEGRSGLPEHINILWEAARRRQRRGSLEEALEAFAAVHRRLIAVLTDMPDAILRRPWHPAYPDTLAANIARNTYRHYEEHLTVLRQSARFATHARSAYATT